jgi:hypothetical protein
VILGLFAIAILLAVLALVAWAACWRTLEWLADAEDLLEQLQPLTRLSGDVGLPSTSQPARALLELKGWRRRSPRRTMAP